MGAYRSGGGAPYERYGADFPEGQGRRQPPCVRPRAARRRLQSRFVGVTITSFTVQPNRDDPRAHRIVEDGALRTHIDRTYALNDLGEALERVDSGRTRGTVTVTVTPHRHSDEAMEACGSSAVGR